MKKILFFGLGSIGSRHLRLLQENWDYDIYAYRTKKDQSHSDIRNIYNMEEALQIKPDIVFITNPTFLHIETAFECLKSGVKNFFIEKPLSHSKENLGKFLKNAEEQNAFIYVGYSMRHNPILKRLKEIIDAKSDQIFYAQTICSSYLPDWRPRRNYRDHFSSKESQGGSIMLELIHEFDYNQLLFGKIKSINGFYGKISNLEIDSDDFCEVTLKFHNSKLLASIHLDYFGFHNQRIIKIFTFNEEIIADFIKKEISIVNNQSTKKETFQFERDDYFKEQLIYFLNGVENQSNEINNLKDAKELLEKLLDFKKNNERIY